MRAYLLLLAGVLAAPPLAGQVVDGKVVDAGSNAPVAGATVRLLGDDEREMASAVTDSAGAFAMTAEDGGRFRLAAAGRGYASAVSAALRIGQGDTLTVAFRLAADTALLEPLKVVASRRRRSAPIAAFYERATRGIGFGWFMTRERMEERQGARLSELLDRAPGLTRVPGRSGWVMRGRGGCVPALYVDGMRLRFAGDRVDEWADPDDLEGVEVYTGAQAPPEYGADTGCGAILLWTRDGR
jgi:hypothetical protein